ncbi:MAG: DUF4157 domain-containing protein [Ruminococcaceae bacterium]|nr:DUF4157 domain-containing protein [Oscillospiraceae bacterium]
MSYTYASRKRGNDAAPKKAAAPQPSMDALRAGTAKPTQEQMGHRVDLPDAMRAKMENAFGADLSAVKLYESEAVADAGAKAISQGSSIAFAPGMLDFTSFGGQALLGHELSHVVSQARGEVTGGGFLNDHALEARADREGAMAARGEQVAMPSAAMSPVTAEAAAGPMQAKDKDKSKEQKGAGTPDQGELARQAAAVAQQRQAKKSAVSEPDEIDRIAKTAEEFDSDLAPAQQQQQHTVNTGDFNFGKFAYRGDKDLAQFKELLDAYNTGGGTPEQEIALMQAASSYIGKHSTGKKAKHKGRTDMMEDVLYQLTMKGGTKDAADANIDRMKKESTTDTWYEGDKAKEMVDSGRSTLDSIRGLYSDDKKYSKSMQMIAADVMSRQGQTSYNATTVSGAKRKFFKDGPGYMVNGRVTMGENDSLGTNLHEFTHVANGEIFDNSDVLFAFSPDAKAEDVTGEMRKRGQTMKELLALSGQDNQTGLDLGGKNVSSFTDDRAAYATNWKTSQQYIPNYVQRAEKQGAEDPNNPALQSFVASEKGKLGRAKKIFDDEKAVAAADPDSKEGSDSMVEYDSVINQMLAQYENAGGSKDSQYYRKLKSAALDAHVRRRTAALKKQ